MHIYKMKEQDIPEIVDIWYEASVQAHSFIPGSYWKKNRELMKSRYIPMSETYLVKNGKAAIGFISLVDEYLGALFVRPEFQGKGVGSSLLNQAKTLRDTLHLKVFTKNIESIEFYKKKGFSIISESKDEETGENEYVMEWHRRNLKKHRPNIRGNSQ